VSTDNWFEVQAEERRRQREIFTMFMSGTFEETVAVCETEVR